MNAIAIQDLTDIVGDDTQYPASNGYKNPASPSFIFRDERGMEDSDILWGRDLALDFEEYCAKKEQREQYLRGELFPAFIPDDSRDALEFILATTDQIQEWMEHPTPGKRPVMVQRHKDGHLVEWAPQTEAEATAYFERQESRGFANWLIGWHKRRPGNNDHWRRFVAPLANVLDCEVMGITAQVILRTMRDTLPFAPGPVKDTIFVNPDKSRVVTKLDAFKAKVGYQARHGISDELVTMDRVQYEGQRHSNYVIGVRKASDKTASAFYDADPVFGDNGYIPRGCALVALPRSADGKTIIPTMPDSNCYRLTIRELERAIIAGAQLHDDELDVVASGFEDQDSPFDTREGGLSFDGSCDFRMMVDLDEQEQWLYWTLWGAGLENACQSLMLADSSDIERYLPGLDGALSKLLTDDDLTEDEDLANGLLETARQDDLDELEKTGRVQWSRFDYLRGLARRVVTVAESATHRELVNNHFELNLDVINNNTIVRGGDLRFPGQPKRPAYTAW